MDQSFGNLGGGGGAGGSGKAAASSFLQLPLSTAAAATAYYGTPLALHQAAAAAGPSQYHGHGHPHHGGGHHHSKHGGAGGGEISAAEAESIKAKIMAHPQYSALLAAYLDCQKVGAPPEVLERLTATAAKLDARPPGRHDARDPELDQFMEAYCNMLAKYREELTRPIDEAMEFLKRVESQLDTIAGGAHGGGAGSARLLLAGKSTNHPSPSSCSRLRFYFYLHTCSFCFFSSAAAAADDDDDLVVGGDGDGGGGGGLPHFRK
jgi:hypothetical protein